MENVFVCATGKDVGKSTTSLGIIHALVSRGYKVRFIKPVGQSYVIRNGAQIDKDAVLMQDGLGISGDLASMSPVTVPRGFVEQFIFERDIEPVQQKIRDAYANLCDGADCVVVEGTGHAGVGACFDLSNAAVARMLGLKTILVAEGGIGSTLDEVALNLALFRLHEAPVLGVVANKLIPEKRERVARALAQGLDNMGTRLLGAVPYTEEITKPTIGQIAAAAGAEVLCGRTELDVRVEHIQVAAMEPQHLIPRIRRDSMIITPGDRLDNIMVALHAHRRRRAGTDFTESGNVVGLMLTGGFLPHRSVLGLLENSEMPVFLSKSNTYNAATAVRRMVFKILPQDTDKIALAKQLINQYVDIDGIIDTLGG